MRYKAVFNIPYHLSAYEQVTLKERFESELQLFLGDRSLEINYLCESED